MLELFLIICMLSGIVILVYMHRRRLPERLSILTVKSSRKNPQPVAEDETIAVDRIFVDKAVKGGIYGLLLGALGIEKSRNPDVKAFAAKMVQEHQAMNAEIMAIARRKRIELPKNLDQDQQSVMQKLSQLSGPIFDSEFLIAALTEHQNTLDMFQQKKQEGKDKDIQKYVAHALPRLKIHIKLGNKAEASLAKRN